MFLGILEPKPTTRWVDALRGLCYAFADIEPTRLAGLCWDCGLSLVIVGFASLAACFGAMLWLRECN